MITKLLTFLNEMGFSEIQINIYKYLLIHKFGVINDIKNSLNYSYSQVHHNISILEDKKLVESSPDSNPKLYFKINPKIALNELVNKKYSNIKENIKKLDKELEIKESRVGVCLRDTTFYHYSNINLGIENFYILIEKASTEIIMSSLAPSLIKKLEPALYNAFMRGVRLKLYFSNEDFEEIKHYFDIVTNILKRVGIIIIETQERTCQRVRFNDEIVNMGNILIDEPYLNAIVFRDDEIFHIDGFHGTMFVQQAKNWLSIKTVVKRIEMEYPRHFQDVLSIINEYKLIKTRDLSKKSRIGGAKLREILEFFVKEGIIQEEYIKTEKAGRPKQVYSIKE